MSMRQLSFSFNLERLTTQKSWKFRNIFLVVTPSRLVTFELLQTKTECSSYGGGYPCCASYCRSDFLVTTTLKLLLILTATNNAFWLRFIVIYIAVSAVCVATFRFALPIHACIVLLLSLLNSLFLTVWLGLPWF